MLGYCAYQVAVVLPVAVIVYGFEPISVARLLENRVALMLVPFVYLVGLKYMTPQRLIDWVNAAAVCMALFALYNYATGGVGGSAARRPPGRTACASSGVAPRCCSASSS